MRSPSDQWSHPKITIVELGLDWSCSWWVRLLPYMILYSLGLTSSWYDIHLLGRQLLHFWIYALNAYSWYFCWSSLSSFFMQENVGSSTCSNRHSVAGKIISNAGFILFCFYGKWGGLDRWPWWAGWRICCIGFYRNVDRSTSKMFRWVHLLLWFSLNGAMYIKDQLIDIWFMMWLICDTVAINSLFFTRDVELY